MTKLTNNQRTILNAASRSANLIAWPLPRRLKLSAGSAGVVISGLLKKGLLEKRQALGNDAVWKEENGKLLTLVISKAGLTACEIVSADVSPKEGPVAAKQGVAAPVSSDEARRPRPGTKLAVILELLTRDQGATLSELADATSWQLNTIRGTLAGAMTKRFGFVIRSDKTTERGRVYRASR